MIEDEYAYALFEIGKEKNKIDIFTECFLALSKTIDTDNFLSILANESIDKNIKKDMIKKVYKSLDEDFIYFLYVVIDHNRIKYLDKIIDSYKKYVLEETNTIKASVISANKLNDKALSVIKTRLQERYKGKNIVISNIIDESLLGGVKVEVNNEALDLSLKEYLNRLKDSI